MMKERLLKLADLLEQDAKNENGVKFDLESWGVANNGNNPTVSCNTSACAIGLACLSRIFEQDGLTYEVNKLSFGRIFIEPMFGDFYNWTATEKFFGISIEISSQLFSIASYEEEEQRSAQGELAVAKRIRQFVCDDELIKIE